MTEPHHDMLAELQGMLSGESDAIANAANTAALIYLRVPRINWVGFYFLQGDTLVLGPFQGKPACVRIPLGQGVCGTAALRRETIVVPDVHEFPGHIACDPDSRSEIVVPLILEDRVVGVLDIDSPHPRRFTADDQEALEAAAAIWLRASRLDAA